MRVAEKLAIIDRIGRELQSRYRYEDIDAYLAEFGIDPPIGVTPNSKWVYSKAALAGVPLSIITRIAEDLDMGPNLATAAVSSPPNNWRDITDFRLFISHIAKHKDRATRLKECLQPHGISGFVAHEDINPTLEWQQEIERALYCMDAMVAIHTPGFSRSYWHGGQSDLSQNGRGPDRVYFETPSSSAEGTPRGRNR